MDVDLTTCKLAVLAVALVAASSLPACVSYRTTSEGSSEARSGLACLNDASLGLTGGPAHSAQAARCIRSFVGIQGKTIGADAQAGLAAKGFTCSHGSSGFSHTCTSSFATNASMVNSVGSGDSRERRETSVTIGYNGTMLTTMTFIRTASTSFADSAQANRLVERSANLIDD